MLKDRSTYEIMRPEHVGLAASNLVLGKHSGRHALRVRLEELGYLSARGAEPRLRPLQGDRRQEEGGRPTATSRRSWPTRCARCPRSTTLDQVQVSCGEPLIPTATVQIRLPSGEVRTADAAPARARSTPCTRRSTASSAPPNRSRCTRSTRSPAAWTALAEVTLRIDVDGRTYHGRGADTDIVVASASAYMNALNRAGLTGRERGGRAGWPRPAHV